MGNENRDYKQWNGEEEPQQLPPGTVQVQFIRRQHGTEVHCTANIDPNWDGLQTQTAAEIYIDACELVDGHPGYASKRARSDEDKAYRKGHAIAASKARKAKG